MRNVPRFQSYIRGDESQEEYRPASAQWDDQSKIDINSTWHPRRDAGMKVRCDDCRSNLRIEGSQYCELCGYRIERRRTA